MYKNYSFIAFILFIIISFSNGSFAYNDDITHPDITEKAIQVSQLEQYLINSLGLTDGLKTKYNYSGEPLNIKQLLREGSTDEDDPTCRAANHFHDPTKPWNASYVTDQPGLIGTWCDWTTGYSTKYSNITWATGFASRGDSNNKINPENQTMGWGNARGYYYLALTSITIDFREDFYAKTFQSIGQVMHLLEDVSVPAHVRNDFKSHMEANGIKLSTIVAPSEWFNQPYEKYVKEHPNLVTTASATMPNFTAPYVTDFWDTDQYNGNNPSTDLSQGLAEFTNANYFSDETVPNNNPTPEHTFDYPQVNTVDTHLCQDFAQNSSDVRIYVGRDGKPDCDHFAAVSLLEEEINITNNKIPNIKLWLDNNVHETYANELIPRAVGYSAGLLNYFFRGDISLEANTVSGPGYIIVNNSSEDMIGTFELYYDDLNNDRRSIPDAVWDLTLGASGSGNNKSGNITFTPPGDAKEPATYMLVFKGKIGNELDAVAGRVIPTYRLTVNSNSNGIVTSGNGNIYCGSACYHDYIAGTEVTLTAFPASGWNFNGWSAPECPGTGDCIITLNQDTVVAPLFSPPYSWVTETVTYPRATGYVGSAGGHTSIAVDSLDRVHVGYYFADPITVTMREDYYYALKENSSWSGRVLGGYSNREYTGEYSSMAVDSFDNVHTSFLKYKYSNSLLYSTNSPSGAWNDLSMGNASYGQTSIAVDSTNHAHISYSGPGQKYLTNASGSWASYAIDSANVINNHSAIALDLFDRPHISFSSGGRLWHASEDGRGLWSKEIIDNTGGAYTSIAIDAFNNLHVSYSAAGYLNYATNKDVLPGFGNCPGNTDWNCEVIDSSGGAFTSIALDSAENVHISYNAGGRLKHALGSFNAWHIDSMESIASNSNTSIAVDSSDIVHISYKNSSNRIRHAFTSQPAAGM